MIIARTLFFLSAGAAFLFVLSGYGYQWEVWSLGAAFTLLRYSAYVAIGLLVVNIAGLFLLRKADGKPLIWLVAGIVLTGGVAGTAYYWQNIARSVPPIHDISTDLENPPEFVDVIPLRADAPNPPEYAGEETVAAQREAYPELTTVVFSASKEEIMQAATDLVRIRGWDLVSKNVEEGRIEATETLAWFGFKDDVVLRFEAADEGTRVDMRSKSRIGRSDLGVNAKRIERFFRDLGIRSSI